MRLSLIAILLATALVVVIAGSLSISRWIEADLERRAHAAIAGLSPHPIALASDGFALRVAGLTDTEAERREILDILHALDPQVTVQSTLEVLPRAVPYRISAQIKDGRITLTGAAPTAAARARIVAAARAANGGAAVANGLALAAGVPEGNWEEALLSALPALAQLDEGVIEVVGLTGRIAGRTNDPDKLKSVQTYLTGTPAKVWKTDIVSILPAVSPYEFTASITRDRDLVFTAHAPEPATAERLREAARRLEPRGDVHGRIILADGMPGPTWPGVIERALAALVALRDGTLIVRGEEVEIAGVVADEVEKRWLETKVDPSWNVVVDILDPAPRPSLIIRVEPDLAPIAFGRLPSGLSPEDFAENLPEVQYLDPLSAEGDADSGNWRLVLQAVATILPRLGDGEILIAHGLIRVRGELSDGFSGSSARAGLRAILPPGWDLHFGAIEAAPDAQITLRKSQRGLITIQGIMPTGVTLASLPAALTIDPDHGLGTGAKGDPLEWERALTDTASVLLVTRDGEAKITERRIALSGQLSPGQTIDELTGWLGPRLAEGWRADLGNLTAVAATDGQIRRNISSGRAEVLTHGFWLPQLALSASVDTCAQAIADVQKGQTLDFQAGSRRLDETATPMLNALASLAGTCLDLPPGFQLVIEGHTDAQGDATANLKLSEARASAIRDALAARGVPAERITARGLGESTPIADNETEEGRARNRRIVLRWEGQDPLAEANGSAIRTVLTEPASAASPVAEEGAAQVPTPN